MIEQAFFGSAQTHRTEGYHLLRRSAGLAEIDARDLVTWCPTHDSLLRGSLQATSVNFHRLSSGAYCISRSRPASSEYSCRGGQHVMTHCLVVPPEVLLRFSNNPFAVLRAATALGVVGDDGTPPDRLDPLHLRGRALSVDTGLIESYRQSWSIGLAVQLLSELATMNRVGWLGQAPPEQLVAVLFNLLPVSMRGDISFATGLKFSSCRPYRLQGLPNDRAELRRFQRQANVSVVDESDTRTGKALVGRWAVLVDELLQSDGLDWLAGELGQSRHAHRKLDELDALALELQAKYHIAQSNQKPAPANQKPAPATGTPAAGARPADKLADPVSQRSEAHVAPGDHRRDDAAHRRRSMQPAGSAAATETAARSKQRAKPTNPLDPKIMEVLDHLDEAVYAAIGGDAAALERVSVLWPLVQDELGAALIEESRENYLRYALASWTAQQDGSARNPDRAISALDVLGLLFEH